MIDLPTAEEVKHLYRRSLWGGCPATPIQPSTRAVADGRGSGALQLAPLACDTVPRNQPACSTPDATRQLGA